MSINTRIILDTADDSLEYSLDGATLTAHRLGGDMLDYEFELDKDITDNDYEHWGETIKLDYLMTPPNERGQGKASSLIQKLIADAKALSVDTIYLNACPMGQNKSYSKTQLVKFYSRFGFKEFRDQGGNTLMTLRLSV